MNPSFSLLHATARLPGGWIDAREAFILSAARWDAEYILAVDERDLALADGVPANVKVVVNRGHCCAVDAWNAAARESTGTILITVADDLRPPQNWDRLITEAIIAAHGDVSGFAFEQPYAVEVKSGTNPADSDRCMLHSIITRRYYQKLGCNIFDPKFFGMGADVWFTEKARRDGVIVDARHIVFRHVHPQGTMRYDQFDEIYKRQNAPGRYEHAALVLAELRKELA